MQLILFEGAKSLAASSLDFICDATQATAMALSSHEGFCLRKRPFIVDVFALFKVHRNLPGKKRNAGAY